MILQSATFPSGLLQNLASSPPKKQSLVIYKDPFPFRKPKSCTCICPKLGFEDIAEIAHNKVLIAAGVSAAIGQLSKPLTSFIFYGNNFDFKTAFQAGGFPSTHSSAVVATASTLGLERGFSDSIFGLTVVYAGLIMYDAQGVRREVGNHAKELNKILPKTQVNSISSKDRDDVIDSEPGTSPSFDLENLAPLLSDETSSCNTPKPPAPLLVRSNKRMRQVVMQSSVAAEAEEESEFIVAKTSTTPLKESIGHTEVEVIAGALLGFFVSLAVYIIM